MSGDLGSVSLQPVVTALQSAITPDNIVSFFATGVMVALPLILTWFGCKWIKSRCVHYKVCEQLPNWVLEITLTRKTKGN